MRSACRRHVEPLAVLVLLPILVGAIADAAIRDAKRASFAAAIAAAVAVALVVQTLDRNEGWAWIAAVLVSPLSVALAVATVAFWHGRGHRHRRPRDTHA